MKASAIADMFESQLGHGELPSVWSIPVQDVLTVIAALRDDRWESRAMLAEAQLKDALRLLAQALLKEKP